MFRKSKKAKDYYDDYYYDDDDYYDDYYYEEYYEEDKEPEKTKSSGSTPKSSAAPKGNNFDSLLSEKDRELANLKREKEELAMKLSSVQALPNHYQQLEEDSTAMKAELAALRSENTRMTQEIHQNMEVVSRAEASARQFQREINVKQTELDQLTEKMLNVQTAALPDPETEQEKELLKKQVRELRQELTAAKDELLATNSRLIEEGAISKEDIAEVMLEAKSKARQIVDQANYDSRRIVSDAERDLENISQDARTLYQKIYATKSDSEMIFEELLRKLTILSDVERPEEE